MRWLDGLSCPPHLWCELAASGPQVFVRVVGGVGLVGLWTGRARAAAADGDSLRELPVTCFLPT